MVGARTEASLRKPGSLSEAAAVVVCLGTNDVAKVKSMPDVTPFVDRVKEFLNFLGCRRLLVVGPLGLRHPEGVKVTAGAIERAVREMGASVAATFHDVSSIRDVCYQKKDRTHLTPGGQAELAMSIAKRLKELLRCEDEAPKQVPSKMENRRDKCCKVATTQARGVARVLLVCSANYGFLSRVL